MNSKTEVGLGAAPVGTRKILSVPHSKCREDSDRQADATAEGYDFVVDFILVGEEMHGTYEPEIEVFVIEFALIQKGISVKDVLLSVVRRTMAFKEDDEIQLTWKPAKMSSLHGKYAASRFDRREADYQ